MLLEMEFYGNNLDIKREDFVVEDVGAMFTSLKIFNRSERQRRITVSFTADVDLRPSFRAENMKDGNDTVECKDGRIVATDGQYAMVAGSSEKAVSSFVDNKKAILAYSFDIAPDDSVFLPVLIVGESQSGAAMAQSVFNDLIHDYEKLKAEKQAYYEDKIFGGVRFNSSDENLNDAFYCAKANILMGTMDLRPYYKYPFIAAGVPVYARLFGNDFCFSSAGITAAGFGGIARSSLACITDYTRLHARAPHEVSPNGVLLGWDHVQVTPQYVAASWDYYVWTKDKEYLTAVYPLCKQIIEDVLATSDQDQDQYIEGHGLMEEREFQADWEELTSSAFMYPAFVGLSGMAEVLTKKQEETRFAEMAAAYKTNFNRDWWGVDENIWASAISSDGVRQINRFWNVTLPQKTGLADEVKGVIALDNISRNFVNDKWGMVGKSVPGEDISNAGVGLVHNNILATSAFKYGQGSLGWKLLRMTMKSPLELNQLGLFDECQPSGCSDISQLWSYAPFLESIIQGLLGVSPDGVSGDVEIYPCIPDDLSFVNIKNLGIGDATVDVGWKKANGRIEFDIRGYNLADSKIIFRIASDKSDAVRINGDKVKFKAGKYYGAPVSKTELKLPAAASK